MLFLISCDEQDITDAIFEGNQIENPIDDETKSEEANDEIEENDDDETKPEEVNEENDDEADNNPDDNQEENTNEESGITKELFSSILKDGSWNVSKLIKRTGVNRDDFIENTGDFTAYSFVFNVTDEIIVTKNNEETKGIWRIKGDSKEGFYLELDFANNTSLSDLTNKWPIIALSETDMDFVLGELDIFNKVDNRTFLSLQKK